MPPRLRVGFLFDSLSLPAWELATIDRIIASDYAEIVFVALNQSSIKKGPSFTTFWRGRGRWFYDVLNALDEKLFLRRANASTRVEASATLANIPILQVETYEAQGHLYFPAGDVDQIQSYDLDIFVNMGWRKLSGEVLSVARYGIWAYRWGDPDKIKDGLTGFWEVVERWPETAVALQQSVGKSNRILFESWFFTYPYSPARSRNCILWAASSFLPRQMKQLHQLGEAKFFEKLKPAADETSPALRSNDIPSTFSVLWIAIKLSARNLVEIYRRIFFQEHWGLLSSYSPNFENNIHAYKKISPPPDRFWADPHVVYRKPNHYVFVEEYVYQARKGQISVIEVDSEGNHKSSIPVLSEDWHLSFPFIFEWMGCYYMIPESSEHRTIDLYECVRFPDQWRHKMTLMKDVVAVDTTACYRSGKWWLFTAIAEQSAAAPQVELFVFYSDELFTDQWHAHVMNPIISDVKRARGAGSLFTKDGRLFRPSQDCSKTYGYGFDLNEVITLSETEYCEKTITSLRPDPRDRIMAIHTYANQGNLTVLDALVRQPKWMKTA